MQSKVAEQTIGYLELCRRNSNYRYYYLAHTVSLLGDWFNIIAILSLLRSLGHDGAGAFGGVFIAKSLATLMILPIGGVIVDRFSRRKIMVFADIGRALVVFAMFSVVIYPSVWVLYGLLWMQSALTAFFDPAKNAMLPDVVSKEELPTATAINAMTWSLMLAVGTGLGGIVSDQYGWQWALSVDGCSYLVSGLSLYFLQIPTRVVKDGAVQILQPFVEGWQYIVKRPSVWSLILIKFFWGIMGSVSVMLALLGEHKYLMASGAMTGVSVLYIARGIGTGLGPVLAHKIVQNDPKKIEYMIGYSFICASVFYSVLCWMNSIWQVAALVVCAHLGGAVIWVFSALRLQQIVPSEIRGRVFSWDLLAFLVMHCLSIYAYSYLVDEIKIEPDVALSLGGAVLFIPTVLWFLRLRYIGISVSDIE